MPVVKSAPNRFLAASVSSKAPVRTRRNRSHSAFTSGTIKRFPCRPLFRPSWILAKGLCEQSIDDTRKADHLTVGDGRWTSSHSVEQFVEFGSHHRFSRFGDTPIASSKGEFDEGSDFRADEGRLFLTRRGERNRQGSPFDPRQYLEWNPHQKLIRGGANSVEIGLLGRHLVTGFCYPPGGIFAIKSAISRAYDQMVPKRGLEPPRLSPLVPETSASTNSATWALRVS